MEFGMLSHHWDGSLEQVQGWLCSRKYNGWSALWDGGITRGMLAEEVPWYYKGKDNQIASTGLWTLGRTKLNKIRPKVIQAPSYFTNKLPINVPVHGELWYKDRKDIVKKTCGLKYGYSPMWYNIGFMAFNIKPYSLWEKIIEVPKYRNITSFHLTHPGENFQKTLSYLNQYTNEIFTSVPTWPIITEQDIKNSQKVAIGQKWEGLMFANPVSKYECKRSWNNLKWKGVYETEAAVYGYEEGKTGRVIGKVGAIKATMVWDEKVISAHGGKKSFVGKEVNFCVSGLMDTEREWEKCKQVYPIGSKIKFKYSEVSTHGVPQSCNIYREK